MSVGRNNNPAEQNRDGFVFGVGDFGVQSTAAIVAWGIADSLGIIIDRRSCSKSWFTGLGHENSLMQINSGLNGSIRARYNNPNNAGGQMSSKDDIYLNVVAAAVVAIPNKLKEAGAGRVLIKTEQAGAENLVGLHFTNVQAVDSCMNALKVIRDSMTKGEQVHPKLSGPTDGKTH